MVRSAVLVAFLGLLAWQPAHAGESPDPIDLSKVAGADEFPGGEAERTLLAKNGFVVLPRFHKQIFSPYLGGALPYYVTCDSAHRTYHVLFEDAVKGFEQVHARLLKKAVQRLHRRLDGISPTTPPLRILSEGRPLAMAHVAVAARLFGLEAAVPAKLESIVAAEIARIEAAEGSATSPLYGSPEDYADYRPRGLYEGDPTLEAYYRAAKWLARRGLRIGNDRETCAAVLIAREFAQDLATQSLLKIIDESLGWLVGPPDDLTAKEYAQALRSIVGDDLSDATLDANFDEIRAALAALRDPEINADLLQPDAWRAFRRTTKGLRLFPARLTADAWLFQKLFEQVPGRKLPSGLDVALALGSKQAGIHLAAAGAEGKQAAELVRARATEFRRRLGKTHYGATLRAASILFNDKGPLLGGESAPRLRARAFSTPAWHDRLLATGLSGWASLRHAWVLQAKTAAFLMGVTDDPPGVVEPVPHYYAALAHLARTLFERGDTVGAWVADDVRARITRLVPLLEKIVDQQMPTEEEINELSSYGTALNEILTPRSGESDAVAYRRAIRDMRAWLSEAAAVAPKTRATIEGLGTSRTRELLGEFIKLMQKLADIARRQLAGTPLNHEDARLIRNYGKTIAALQFFDGNSYLSPRRQMGLVVDVASNPLHGTRLEAAVGATMEIYVVLPIPKGTQRLYRGGVYAYYEFPSRTPLTDAAWRRQVSAHQTPHLPAWTASYVAGPDVSKLVARIAAGERPTEISHLNDPRLGRALLARLRAAPQEDDAQDAHLTWVARQLARYGRGELKKAVFDALADRVLTARQEVAREGGTSRSQFARRGPQILGRLADEQGILRLVALLREPPEHARDGVRSRLATALTATRDPAILAHAEPLLTHAEAAVREHALAWIGETFHYRTEGPVREAASRLTRFLAEAGNAPLHGKTLNYLIAFKTEVNDEDAARIGVLLESPDARTRRFAAWALGDLRGRGQVPRLLDRLELEEESFVRAEIADSVGKALQGVKDRPELVARTVKVMIGKTRTENWQVSLACMRTLGAIGGQGPAGALHGIAADRGLHAELRSGAARALGKAGEAAVPHLFRLLFDETETGGSVNDHKVRLCDVAGEYLDIILKGHFGWRMNSQGLGQAEVLEAMRAEAKKRGYVR